MENHEIHGHEVLDMMDGHTYTEESLVAAIKEKFGNTTRFCTCKAHNMTAEELVFFLKERGKFKAMGEEFTSDLSKKCNG